MELAARIGAWHGGKPTARDYVQDGLIAMWDGIENAGWGVHDSTIVMPVDLTGRCSDQYVVGSIEIGETFWKQGETDYFVAKNSEFYDALLSRTITVEMVVKPESYMNYSGWYHFGINASSRQLVLDQRKERDLSPFGGLQAYATSWVDLSVIPAGSWNKFGVVSSIVVKVLDTGVAEMLANGVEVFNRKIGSVKPVSDEMATAYRQVTSNIAAKAERYAMRVYGRVLANAEIAANYAIDKARFGIT